MSDQVKVLFKFIRIDCYGFVGVGLGDLTANVVFKISERTGEFFE